MKIINLATPTPFPPKNHAAAANCNTKIQTELNIPA